jgi:hypothetical protein
LTSKQLTINERQALALQGGVKAFKLLFATLVVCGSVPVTEPIRVRKETKEELNRLKVHPRETYDDVITRLIEEYKRCKGVHG